MSSDRLSFNQSADSDDDGARWEAYLELLKRTGASPSSSETDEAPPEVIEAESLARFESAEPEADPTAGELFAPEAMAAPDPGLGPLDSLYSPRPAARFRYRGSRLVAAAAALVAAIAIAALLVPRQHEPRNTLAPTRSAAIVAVHTAPPVAAPSSSAAPTASEALASSAAPANSPRQAKSVRRRAHWAHPCANCGHASAQPPRHSTPQCWTPVPILDAHHNETHLTDCVHFVPPVGPWRPTPEH